MKIQGNLKYGVSFENIGSGLDNCGVWDDYIEIVRLYPIS